MAEFAPGAELQILSHCLTCRRGSSSRHPHGRIHAIHGLPASSFHRSRGKSVERAAKTMSLPRLQVRPPSAARLLERPRLPPAGHGQFFPASELPCVAGSLHPRHPLVAGGRLCAKSLAALHLGCSERGLQLSFVDQASFALYTVERSNQLKPLGPAGSLEPVWPDPFQPAPNPLPIFSRPVRPRVSALMLSIALD
ncbi:uncharacterized protein LOC125541675 [Triticum urartu]|uniref:uncharacterized protein LOC125541675 n=1 Tax=Triticum urartu TaxID=4572 RepID=UPI002042F809|nr:uncharacterized protein LOC125541675 [Triticum urartu]